MEHKKEIYTTVRKWLPSTNCFIDRATTAEEFNRLTAAFYYLFNSDLLTKGDYAHILKVLREKLPIYERGGNREAYRDLSVSYAEFGYPPNPDLRRVICDFIDHIDGIPCAKLSKALYDIGAQVEKSSEFVGTETHARGFSLTPITAEELTTIKGIILVGK